MNKAAIIETPNKYFNDFWNTSIVLFVVSLDVVLTALEKVIIAHMMDTNANNIITVVDVDLSLKKPPG